MNPEDFAEVQRRFRELRDASPRERRNRLCQESLGDEIRAEVESLLVVDDQSESSSATESLREPYLAAGSSTFEAATQGTKIGRKKSGKPKKSILNARARPSIRSSAIQEGSSVAWAIQARQIAVIAARRPPTFPVSNERFSGP